MYGSGVKFNDPAAPTALTARCKKFPAWAFLQWRKAQAIPPFAETISNLPATKLIQLARYLERILTPKQQKELLLQI